MKRSWSMWKNASNRDTFARNQMWWHSSHPRCWNMKLKLKMSAKLQRECYQYNVYEIRLIGMLLHHLLLVKGLSTASHATEFCSCWLQQFWKQTTILEVNNSSCWKQIRLWDTSGRWMYSLATFITRYICGLQCCRLFTFELVGGIGRSHGRPKISLWI